jgi:hypothetical protein
MQSLKEEIEKEMQENNVFILGAGFSVGAGIPTMDSLLEKAMSVFKSECNGIYQRITEKVSAYYGIKEVDYQKINFSELCTFLDYLELIEFGGGERFSDYGSRERLALKYFLCKAISVSTPEIIPDYYLNFAKNLKKHDVVLTFNWDLLLEKSLIKCGKKFAYCNFEDNHDVDVYLIKPHGSMNWSIEERKNEMLRWIPMNLQRGITKHEIYYTNDLIYKYPYQSTSFFKEINPFIVLPGFGKGFDVRRLSAFWYKLESVFCLSRNIFVIGLSVSEDDYFIKSFLKDNLDLINSNITIMNPDPEIEKRYNFIKNTNLSFLKEPFGMNSMHLIKRGT